MKRHTIIFLAGTLTTFLILLFSSMEAAAEDAGEEVAGWSGEAEVGYIMTTGNTETTSLNARLALEHEMEKWQNGMVFESIYGSEENQDTGEDVTTVQRFLISGKSNYKFDSRNFGFLQGLYEDDRFSGYEYQATVSAGYRRIIIDRERTKWSAEIGPGYRYSKIDDDTADDDESEAIIHLGTLFVHELSENALFSQEITSDAGPENTITRSITSLRAQIIGSLAMKLSFRLKHTSDVPEGTTSTDTETTLTLVYGF